ncbi:MAG: formate dehydrogenase subunit gamma [Gammaproteobacteria bacterium]|nr:formate dehydrogenase subunit gamma [Gammaproteobacteria bacterium]
MRAQTITRKSRGRRRIALVTVALSMLLAMALPLTGYIAHDAGLAWAQSDDAEKEAVNPRAEYWRAVRQGTAGYSAVSGAEAGVLIQNGGENWRNARNGPLKFFGGSLLIAVLIAILVKHLVTGKDMIESPAGRKMTRWSGFDRALHWYVGITFIILAITGLSLLFGRALLIPLLGKEGFSAWAQLAKPVHDYLSLPFIVGFALLLLLWIPRNFLRSYDFAWLKSLGGLIGKDHPQAGFMNGGEKVFFWILFFGGVALMVSGFYLLFPNLGWERETMQLSHIVHSASGLFLIAVSLGHIYLGSIGVEGVLEGMVSGEVDEGFAKQHHNLWYDEVKGNAAAPVQRETAPGESSAATT